MAGEAEFSAVVRTGEMTAKALLELLKALQMTIAKSKAKSAMSAADDLGIGKVSHAKLMQEAHRKNFAVETQDGISKNDMPKILKYAKNYGIPIAVTGRGDLDNIKVSFRASDRAIFEQIMTDIVKEKLAERPHELMSFKIEDARNTGLFRQLVADNNLTADVVIDKNGDIYCVHEIADKKAFEMVKKDFQKTFEKIRDELHVENIGEYVCVEFDNKSITFSKDNPPDYDEIKEYLHENYEFDDIETGLAIAKIADSLPQVYQQKMLDENPLNSVTDFESNIRLKDENPLILDYQYYRINTKNGLESYMIQDEDGRTATLIPEIMTTSQMIEMIETRLGITDKNVIDRLIEKVEILNTINRKIAKDSTENYSHGDLNIQRSESGKFFKIASASLVKAYSVDDKRAAIVAIQRDFNVTNEDAQEIFQKARNQRIISDTKEELLVKSEFKERPPEKSDGTVRIERQIGGTFTVALGGKICEYKLNEIEETRRKLQEDFEGISDEDIDKIFEKANAQTSFDEVQNSKNIAASNEDLAKEMPDRQPPTEKMIAILSKKGFNNPEDWTFDEALDMVGKIEENGWKIPNDISPAEYVPESLKISPDQKIKLDKNQFNVVDGVDDEPIFGRSR